MWRAGFGRGFGPVMRQTTKQMNGADGAYNHALSEVKAPYTLIGACQKRT
jgi:hypothetical protein